MNEFRTRGSLDDLICNIDYGIKHKINTSIICDDLLASEIVDYIGMTYNLFPEDDSWEVCDQCLIDLVFWDDQLNYFVESTRTKDGIFKLSDIGGRTDYYIVADLSKEIVFEKLLGYPANYFWWELVE